MLHEGNNLTPESFQKEIDSLRKGDVLELLPHEFPGSVILNRSLIVDGQRATIWALKGPVMVVQSHGVVPRNLRIEVIADHPQAGNDEDCALTVQSGVQVKFDNVEVRGAVAGLDTEEGAWQYPYSIELGSLAYSKD
jgi:hypothetical protein